MGAALARELTTVNNYFDDVQVGDYFKTGSRTVTAADIERFCEISGDFSPLHTDEAFAIAQGFSGRIAHGCLVLSIGTGLVFDLSSRMDKVVAFYGMDRVRFTGAVCIGDTIRMEGEIIELVDKGSRGGVIKRRDSFRNQRDEVVAVVEKSTLNLRRPSGDIGVGG